MKIDLQRLGVCWIPRSKMRRIQGIIYIEVISPNSDRKSRLFVASRQDAICSRERARFSRLSRIFYAPFRAFMVFFLLAAIILTAQPESAAAQTTATYTATFTGSWNTQSTPGGVVGGAHFTTLACAVHNSDVTFWESGSMATPGVELVAEIGGTSRFQSEVSAAGANAKRGFDVSLSFSTVGSKNFEVEFAKSHPLFTLLSMLGPSPDWFVGVSRLSLLDGQGNWRSSHSVDLFAYDAGTEDGENFQLNNSATNPQGTITSLRNKGRFSNVPIARLSFTLKTLPPPPPPPQNNAPEFSGTSITRSLLETVGDATAQTAANIGAAVTATDSDNDTLVYSLGGTDAGKFTIVSGSGQIRTRAGEIYDREARASYSVTVRADDGNGGTDTVAVTINLTDVAERPLPPAAPSVSSGSATSVNVMWSAPSNSGRPAIASYNLQYRKSSGSSWMSGPQNVTATNTSIMGLEENAEYQVRVRARNSDGDGPWSETGMGRSLAPSNAPPEFTEGMTATRSFTETVGDATVQTAADIGAAVTAADADGNTLSYSLEGAYRNEFTVDSSGQISTRVGKSYDREARASYLLMVKADDGNGGTDTIAVTITLKDVAERPLKPDAPSLSPESATSVNVMWSAPSNAGRPAIASYDLQYRGSSDSSWRDGPQNVSAMNTSIMGLEEDTRYQVWVRASNSDGDGPWSESGSIMNRSPVRPPSPPPAMEAAEVDTDNDLMEFVEDAARRIENSDTFWDTLGLLDEFRDKEGEWNDGSMYLVLLTRRGGVYFHANDREAEDLDWSGILSCEGGGDVLDTQRGCFIQYDGGTNGYAHPFSASYVPLAHGEEKFVLLGGFDETPEGKSFMGEEIAAPLTEAGGVDADDELRKFVGEAGRFLMRAIASSGIGPAQLRGILRQDGPWRAGDVHVYIMDEAGSVIFDGADRNREQKDEYAKQYIRDLIAQADKEIVKYREGGLLRRGYTVRVEVPLEEENETDRVYIVGSGYLVEEPPSEGQPSDGGDGGGGGCAVGGSTSGGGAFGLFLMALALLLAVSLRNWGGFIKSRRMLMSAVNSSGLPKRNKRSGVCGGYLPRNV